jgi:aspartate dehydrogenase
MIMSNFVTITEAMTTEISLISCQTVMDQNPREGWKNTNCIHGFGASFAVDCRSARQAALRYPQFLNVTAAVALAGIGFDLTEVRVLADPTVPYSRHEVQAEGTFGVFHFEIENAMNISHQGARLVAMSIVHALLQRHTSFIIG